MGDALGEAFDQVNNFHITVLDSLTRTVYVDTIISVIPGAAEHVLTIDLPEEALGALLVVHITAFVDSVELFTTTATATVNKESEQITVEASVRYTGPGIRGSVNDLDGRGIGGVIVTLLQGGQSVAEVATAADGSFLFAGLSAGEYIVRPTATSGLTACPAERNVEVGGADDALVAAFQFKTSCTVRVLVVSGGDVDDTGAAAGQLSGLGDVSAEAFFYINRTPGLDALRAYDAVLVFQNGLFNEAVELGAEISEFVSLGGNVVFASFYWQGRSDSGFGSPGWGSLEGLDPFRSIGGAVYRAGSLGAVTDHLLTAGVSTLTSSSYWGGVAAKGGTTVVASWADGTPLVGYVRGSADQRMVAVSLFPGGGGGDVAVLWGNAVRWAGAAGGPARSGVVVSGNN